jgi:predicted CXXCH cytochrome family protein
VLPGALLFVLLLPMWMNAGVDAAPGEETPPAAAAAPFDVKDCETCHEDAVKGMRTTAHAGVTQSCSSCHGDVTAHLKSNLEQGVPGPIQSMKKAKAPEVNQTCQGCHEKTHNATWAGSAHQRRGLACTTCHSVHAFQSAKSQLKLAQEPENCFSCHGQMRAKSLRTSHHPVREGLMTCSSCHNPHDGSRPKMIKAELHPLPRSPRLEPRQAARLAAALAVPALPPEHPPSRHGLHRHQRRGNGVVGQQPRRGARVQELPPERARRQRADRAVPRALRREP